MDKQKYASRLKDALHRATIKELSNVLMAAAILLLSYFVVTADTSEKTIITPAVISKPFSVQGNEVSPEYLEQMTDFFAGYLLTFHKQNAQYRFDQVLKYMHPSIYNDMKARFGAEQLRISRNDMSSVFFPMSIYVKKNTVYITGEKIGFIGSQRVSQSQKVYEFKYEYTGSNLWIVGYNEVAKNAIGEFEVVKPADEVMIEGGASTTQGSPEATEAVQPTPSETAVQ